VNVARGWAQRSLWLLRTICRLSVRFEGAEHLSAGGYVLAHKHQSELDMVALLAVLRNPAFIVKRELLFVPIWGLWAVKARMIFVSRGARSVALEQITQGSLRALEDARPVVIAPEGTRVRPGSEPAYKYGVVHLYRQLQVPVVPAALNTGIFWPWWRFMRYPGTVTVSFLEPIQPGLGEDAFRSLLTERIETECDRLLLAADSARPRPGFGPAATARLATIREASAAE
jgi:1-acyl-sn-glycerol-3-phosphate acyltransferase